jgi:mono/diheme cytochrome c family protein
VLKHVLRVGLVCFVLAACGGGDSEEASDEDTNTSSLESTTSSSSTTTTSPAITTTIPPTTTTVPPTTTAVSAEQLAKAEALGDIAAGGELFETELELTGPDSACSTCHTLDGIDGRSPSLAGISARAVERVEGLSDIDYLRQSILDPAAFEEQEWPAVMPRTYADSLTEQQVNDLIAFLLTQ